MKLLFSFIVVLMSFSALADCRSDFRSLQDKEKYKLVKERVIRILSKRQLKFLIAPETKAVMNYIDFQHFTFDGDNGLEVTTDVYIDRDSEVEAGHRISIFDGSEESLVRYYLKGDKILYRSWVGRQSDYLCTDR